MLAAVSTRARTRHLAQNARCYRASISDDYLLVGYSALAVLSAALLVIGATPTCLVGERRVGVAQRPGLRLCARVWRRAFSFVACLVAVAMQVAALRSAASRGGGDVVGTDNESGNSNAFIGIVVLGLWTSTAEVLLLALCAKRFRTPSPE